MIVEAVLFLVWLIGAVASLLLTVREHQRQGTRWVLWRLVIVLALWPLVWAYAVIELALSKLVNRKGLHA